MELTYRILNFFLIIKTQILVFFKIKRETNFKNEEGIISYDNLRGTMFKNGWYVTETNGEWKGQDPSKKCWFNPDCVKADGSLRLYTDFNRIPYWTYSGVMKYSARSFRDGIFHIEVDTDFTKNAKFAFWLKNKEKDVKEIDIVEIFHEKFVKIFGFRYTPALLSLHWGSNYGYDHKFISKSIWIDEDSHTFTLTRVGYQLRWYVDGHLAMISNDPHKYDDMLAIIEYSNTKELNDDTAIAIIDDFAIFEL